MGRHYIIVHFPIINFICMWFVLSQNMFPGYAYIKIRTTIWMCPIITNYNYRASPLLTVCLFCRYLVLDYGYLGFHSNRFERPNLSAYTMAEHKVLHFQNSIKNIDFEIFVDFMY